MCAAQEALAIHCGFHGHLKTETERSPTQRRHFSRVPPISETQMYVHSRPRGNLYMRMSRLLQLLLRPRPKPQTLASELDMSDGPLLGDPALAGSKGWVFKVWETMQRSGPAQSRIGAHFPKSRAVQGVAATIRDRSVSLRSDECDAWIAADPMNHATHIPHAIQRIKQKQVMHEFL